MRLERISKFYGLASSDRIRHSRVEMAVPAHELRKEHRAERFQQQRQREHRQKPILRAGGRCLRQRDHRPGKLSALMTHAFGLPGAAGGVDHLSKAIDEPGRLRRHHARAD